MFGDDRYYETVRLYEDNQLDGDGDAVRSYLESIRGSIGCPIQFAMATLDEVATLIPDQKYKDMADGLQQLHREKERRRHYQ